MLLLATLPMFALSYHAVNVDKVTAAAMTAAYASEAEMEAMNTSNLQKIVDHYKSATVATAGILLSKKKDRDAMRNPGLFASEENYYYKRILNLDAAGADLVQTSEKKNLLIDTFVKWRIEDPRLYWVSFQGSEPAACSRPPRTWNSFASSSS